MAGKPVTMRASLVLTALADGPRHGYRIMGEAAELSHGRVKLKIGSLYGVLERLAAMELIEPDREQAHDRRGAGEAGQGDMSPAHLLLRRRDGQQEGR